jgi:5'-nucleotidase / UDP-sugar diphosphatase
MVELPNGLRVGFLGLMGRGAARFAPRAAPVEFSDARVEAAGVVAELRGAGAHIVVAITHSGLAEDRELARDVAGIDIILGGHDHLLLDEPALEAGTVIVHPGSHLRQLFVLEIAYDPATGGVRVRNGETGTPHVVALDAAVGESSWMRERIAPYRARLEARIAELTGGRFRALDATLARSDFVVRAGPPMRESPFGNFVTDAMRVAAESATGQRVDFAFEANGVIRGDMVAGTLEGRRGDLAFYDVAGVVGLGSGPDGRPGYPLVSVWLTGGEVRRVLEVSVLLSELMRNSYFLQASGLRMRYDPRRAILFRVPLLGTPIPTGRAVLSAQREHAGAFVDLARADDQLYHVVTDYYVASFLPMVGQLVPRLALVPKDRHGDPIAIEDAIISRDGRELKVWQAVVEYAAAQPHDDEGVPRIAATYATAEGRLVIARGWPLWLLPLAVVLLVVVAAVGVVRKRRSRRRAGKRIAPERPVVAGTRGRPVPHDIGQ